MTDKEFTPALGYAFLTPLYDLAIALLTREKVWRGTLVTQVNPMPDDRILDVGCGTGALAIRLKFIESSSEIIGLDPDPDVLLRARNKATRKGVDVNWKQGFLTPEIAKDIGTVSKFVSDQWDQSARVLFGESPPDLLVIWAVRFDEQCRRFYDYWSRVGDEFRESYISCIRYADRISGAH